MESDSESEITLLIPWREIVDITSHSWAEVEKLQFLVSSNG